ncbi:MAG: DeoR/GlpR transcriptional regulator [Chloroflexi bacterium]|nr:DeoR/GlpR transcriptional regulator [Chloroflexota bacterium]
MYPQERRQAILRLLEKQGRVMVTELSKAFSVSEVTVRGDLQALAEQGKLIRTHGGAVPIGASEDNLKLERRKRQHPVEKSLIGVAAAAMVEKGDAIYLDGSSTALAIARNLKQHELVTVLTNSVAVAQELMGAPGVRVVLSGGALQPETASLIDVDGLSYFDKFNIQTGFFGAHGLAIPEGLTDISADVAAVKRELVGRCRQVVAIIDASKWGRVGLATFADITDIDLVLTDKDAPLELVRQVQRMGVEVKLTPGR